MQPQRREIANPVAGCWSGLRSGQSIGHRVDNEKMFVNTRSTHFLAIRGDRFAAITPRRKGREQQMRMGIENRRFSYRSLSGQRQETLFVRELQSKSSFESSELDCDSLDQVIFV